MKTDFIVYVFHVPGEDKPFYCGKGHPERPWAHFQARNLEKKTHFYRKLNKLLDQGITPEIKIIARGLTNEQACRLEVSFIACYGRLDIGTGCLCNHTSGGDGGSGCREYSPRIVNQPSFEAILARSKPRSSLAKSNMRAAARSRAVSVDSYSLKTGATIKTYSATCDVKYDGYNSSNIYAVLVGRQKTAYGMGWRHTKAPEIAT